ncbi:PaaI family thioesterase [Streptomyces sp. SID6673]|uniref:PaaI family thioesterase n=2 Tax=Gordonia hankookensis TaxID=589403 RepID=A0ABR7WC34_9ACTN|nr:PaaI family thioesterase [Gordonia hankookensis]NDZ97471.1 PaaI family thioesterase [Streptomyces sp. SID11726]NEB27058.1 PaaI family thioesterase [Streptomyces sp. SID6673]
MSHHTGASNAAEPSPIRELFAHIGFGEPIRDGDELVVELPAAPHVVNTRGGIQGGLIATLIDVVAGMHALEDCPPGIGVVTSDMNIRYLRAVTTGVASARSRIVHSGRRSVIVQVDVYATESDELAVMATANFAKTPRTDR